LHAAVTYNGLRRWAPWQYSGVDNSFVDSEVPRKKGIMRSVCATGASALLLAAAAVAMPGCSGSGISSPSPRVMTLDGGPLLIDRIYPSMEGPWERVVLDTSDLDWVTAYRAATVDDETGEPMASEFLCHSQLQMRNRTRLLVTAPGVEILVFPDGFGMPLNQILSGVPADQREITLLGMVLNNHVPNINRRARVRWEIEYWKNEDIGKPPDLKSLYKVTLPMAVRDLEAYYPSGHGPDEGGDDSIYCVLVEGIPTHWLVPPGTQRTQRLFSDFMPVDAMVHVAAAHLHNYGVYVRLTDVTAGEIIWHSDVEYERDRVQIVKIPAYSSTEGFPVYRDHTYELEAFYDNTTDHDIDAMAQIDLYYHPVNDELITYLEGPNDRPANF